TAGLELRARLDQRVPHRLVGADRLAELPALLRIAPGVVDRGRGDAVGDGGDLQLLDVERRAGEHAPPLIPAVGTAEDVVDRHADLVEDHVGRRRVAEPEVVDVDDRDAGQPGRHEYQGEVPV